MCGFHGIQGWWFGTCYGGLADAAFGGGDGDDFLDIWDAAFGREAASGDLGGRAARWESLGVMSAAVGVQGSWDVTRGFSCWSWCRVENSLLLIVVQQTS